jgi:hypothetical protein
MKIAISVGVGPLHKWGYQHTYRECIASQAQFADHVYMVQSTADETGVQELLDEFKNVTLISNPETWHHAPGATDEVLAFSSFTRFHQRNLSIGRGAAFDDGYRVILSTHSNWYIPRRNKTALRKYCQEFERTGELTGHTWLMQQLHNKLFGPGLRNEGLCNVVNMSQRADVEAYYPDMKWRHVDRAVIPPNVGNICMVDCSYNLLPSEYEGMQHRFYYPGHKGFVWEMRREQLAGRLSRRGVARKGALDYWGKKIAAKSGPEWMGYQILQEAHLLQSESFFAKVLSAFRRKLLEALT